MNKDNPKIALTAKKLNFYYGNTQTLFDINVSFKSNVISVLMGHSGSGKSTLLRVFNRIYELYPGHKAIGEVFYDGKNILSNAYEMEFLRTKIGMVFQKPTPFPMSIYNNIAFALKNSALVPKKEIPVRVEEALKQAALWKEVKDNLNKSGSALSGGQQQRLCIARTLAMKPDILLLDEPTSALDPLSTEKIEEVILDLKKSYTVILVTHNMHQVERIADDIVFLKHGEIKMISSSAKFFEEEQKKSIKKYITHF